jgi:heptose I phosphotransferase
MSFVPLPLNAERAPGLWQRLLHGFRKLRQRPDWQSFAGVGWPDRIMNEELTDRFHAKQGRSIGRWELNDAAGRSLVVYLKRHYRLPRSSGCLAAFFPWRAWSPGLQEWEHLAWAREHGLPAPRAVAAGESIGPWGKLQSFLAVEELTGMLPLHEAVPLAQTQLEPSTFATWKQSLARELARLTRLIHDKNVFHKDLYLCHFYVREDDTRRLPSDWTNLVVMIDFHRLSRHRVAGLWWRVKDLAQLLYSSEIQGVTGRDRLYFWKAYRGEAKRTLLAGLIRWKWKLYRRHNRKRKAERIENRKSKIENRGG